MIGSGDTAHSAFRYCLSYDGDNRNFVLYDGEYVPLSSDGKYHTTLANLMQSQYSYWLEQKQTIFSKKKNKVRVSRICRNQERRPNLLSEAN